MSDRLGPMAWGSSGAVFLGEDLVHTRDYSDDTSRVIDEEVEKILRAAEERAASVLAEHRTGLDAVADALLIKETVDGAEVARLVDSAAGHPVHPTGPKSLAIPSFEQVVANGGDGYYAPPQPTVPPPPQPVYGPYDVENDL